MSGGSKIIDENNKKVLFLETPAPPLEVPWTNFEIKIVKYRWFIRLLGSK